MSASEIVLIVVSGLGVLHGLFLAVFLWLYSRGNQLANRILSMLLLVLSFRVGKSVFLEFTEDLDVKMIFIGLGSLMAIGPLFLLYTRSCTNKSFRFSSKQLFHFIPAIGGIAFGFWIQDHHLETLPKLLFLFLFLSYYGHYLTYILVSYSSFSKKRKDELDEDTYRLLRLLFIGLLVIWIAYVLNLFDDLTPYIVGPVLYSVVAYLISFVVIQNGYIHKVDHSKYKTTPVSEEQAERIFEKVQKIVSDEEQYRNPDLTLKSLSEVLNVSTQVLSMVINQKSKSNFNSFINQYRVEGSKKLLEDKNYKNHTIAAIAFEVGFNSISSFNTSFKKQTGKTPLDYRQHVMK